MAEESTSLNIPYLLETVDLKKRDKIFVLKLQEEVERRKLDPEQLFYEFDKTKSGGIHWNEFGDLLRSKLEIEEFSGSFFHVFKKADVNGDSVLQKEEFIGIFKWNLDVRTEQQQRELQKKIQQLEEILADRESTLETLREQATLHAEGLSSAQKTHDDLKKENIELKKKLNEASLFHQKSVQAILQSSQEKDDQFQRMIENLQNENQNISEKHFDAQQNLETTKSEIQLLQEQNLQLRETIAVLEKQLSEPSANEKLMQQQMEDLKIQLKQLQQTVNEKEGINSEFQAIAKIKDDQIEELQKKLQQSEEENKQVKQDLEKSQAESQVLQKQIDGKILLLHELLLKLKAYKAIVDNIDTQMAQIETAQK